MKKITFIFLLLSATFSHSQKYIDMSSILANVKGNIIIDGNQLQAKHNTREQIIITGKNMIIHDRSSFLFHNVIIMLSGDIVLKGENVKPRLIDSYVFCKNAGRLKSVKIIEANNYDAINIAEVSYIKKLKGNPEIWIYNAQGKRVFKGYKNDAENFKLPISRYDVKVVGHEFKDKILFAL